MSTVALVLEGLTVLHVQATLVLGSILIAVGTLQRVSPRVRHAILSFGLLGLVLLPLQFLLPLQWIPVDLDWVPVDVSGIPDALTLATVTRSTTAGAVDASRTEWSVATIPSAALTAVWGLGAIWFATRAIVVSLGTRSLLRHAIPLDSRMRAALSRTGTLSTVRVALSDRIDAPIVLRVVRSITLLPTDAFIWSLERLEAVVRHELAHVQHRDPAWLRLADLGLALYWMHPLYWFMIWRLRLEAEHAADDVVLSSGMRASSYAAELVDLTRALPPRPRASWATSATRPSQLARRVAHILGDRPYAPPSSQHLIPVALGTLGAVLCFAVLHSHRPRESATDATVSDPIEIPYAELADASVAIAPKGDIVIEIRKASLRLGHASREIRTTLPLKNGVIDDQDARIRLRTVWEPFCAQFRDEHAGVYWIDASVPFSTVVLVARTLRDCGLRHHSLVFDSQYGPRALRATSSALPAKDPAQSTWIKWTGNGHWMANAHMSVEPIAKCRQTITLQPIDSTTYAEVVAAYVRLLAQPPFGLIAANACSGGIFIEIPE